MPETLLIHGWGFKPDCMQDVLSLQQEKAIDLYTLSESLTFDEVINGLAESIDGTVNLVAWSLGGIYAIALTLRFPQKVNKLLLFTSTPCFMQKENWPGISEKQIMELEALIKKDSNKALNTFVGWCSKGHLSIKASLKEARTKLATDVDKEPLLKLLNVLKEFDYRQELKNIARPTKLIAANDDNLIPEHAKRYEFAGNKNIEIETVEQTGHLLPFFLTDEQKQKCVEWMQAS